MSDETSTESTAIETAAPPVVTTGDESERKRARYDAAESYFGPEEVSETSEPATETELDTESAEEVVTETEEVEPETVSAYEDLGDGKFKVFGMDFESPEEAAEALGKKEENLKKFQADLTRKSQGVPERQPEDNGYSSDQLSSARELQSALEQNPEALRSIQDGLVKAGVMLPEDIESSGAADPVMAQQVDKLQSELAEFKRRQSFDDYLHQHGLNRKEGLDIMDTAGALDQVIFEDSGQRIRTPLFLAHKFLVADKIPSIVADAYKRGVEEGRAEGRNGNKARTAGGRSGPTGTAEKVDLMSMSPKDRKKYRLAAAEKMGLF